MDPARPRSRDEFKVALICALPLEANSVLSLFDHHWDDDDGSPRIGKARGDPNSYSIGIMSGHHVVLAHPPGIGTIAAGTIAAFCKLSFTSIKLALVVGICGGAPMNKGIQIHLGDVIISTGIVSYDFGRRFSDRFEMKDTLSEVPGRPSLEIRALLAKLETTRQTERLRSATYYILRKGSRQSFPSPNIHFGIFASGNSVIKSGKERDRLTKDKNAIGFEMEGAGVWDVFPCIVIKGVCDYADSHKNKKWQPFASDSAAACAKVFLGHWHSDKEDIQGAPNELPALPWHPAIPRDSSNTQVPSEHPSGQLYDPTTDQSIQGYYITSFGDPTTRLVEALEADSGAWNNEWHSKSPQTEVNEDFCSYYTETGTPGYNGTDGDFHSAPFSSQGSWEQ
ncbi:uncharacterized protein FPRN_14212 [Fusarium proliferatum]|nr:uncharacterized protein FPRN_14212 [Fusarium proliferatum]